MVSENASFWVLCFFNLWQLLSFSPPGDLLFPSALTNLAVLSYGEVDFASDSAQSSFQCRLDSALSKPRRPFFCPSLTHSHMALPAHFLESLTSTSSEMVPAVLLTVLFYLSHTKKVVL